MNPTTPTEPDMNQLITIAWTIDDFRVVDFETCRVDMGERPKLEPIVVARACTWILDGDAADIEKAKACAADIADSARVYTFRLGTPNPLELAKAAVMAAA